MDVERILAQIEATPTSASVKTVFGEPIKVGDWTIVPVARVSASFGLGFGRGIRPGAPPSEAAGAEGGIGGGGGGKMSVRPVAVIEIAPDRVRVKPIVDVTRIVLAGIFLVAWNVFWITLTMRAVRGRRSRS
jgi:uncharacterized spore protein YtfJ